MVFIIARTSAPATATPVTLGLETPACFKKTSTTTAAMIGKNAAGRCMGIFIFYCFYKNRVVLFNPEITTIFGTSHGESE